MSDYTVIITPMFEESYEKLKRRYRQIDDDFEDFINDIEENGNIGDSVPKIIKDGNKVFKKRMKNSSANKGLSGGFRIIEYLVTEDNSVHLLDIYSKSDQEDIEKKKVLRLIKEVKRYARLD
ncbi:hypothetical protein [Niallia sp. RD1]|uniref:hypothetical protein n=1 Tax=Niallia sp. RD1 TaxID=2962858 RepID=UPI0020C1A2C3|nr:hypothetical protein [Niallia sp. RD1]UTI42113.1 hypothetical protein NKG37_25430 [Niallia sp. RD1]